ncbi:MAG TPA: MoaD/ThiS family protein [Methanospirillum sp.]|uniref:MoaD/ThiS family protein n=1 Tax=Methanospirillum sp. TaxID=45200 RepID=UPI002C10E74F|nr:MoaD/ThiS family protein [Methanospirillum sp.]HWQ64781.1 MoaD/ThiS family protein [Methanospirillum sp.]
MKITIICYARFRDIFGEETQVDLPESASILDAVRHLASTAGSDAELLLTSEGLIQEYVMIVHQEARILPAEAESITLTGGETITLFPPVSGG